ncbi:MULTISPECIES: hypothetical protein [unclassified Aureispira]|uniref:hypothetical protein n=1 Tax=unclassified Aureispira TaxID=2649989 RepID=UPI0006982BE6|nr:MULTISPECIES: hypothetical protein [unclassified Aureispira]WMX14845.1 hypothetical protein QP953_00505 [Aureispira sp. CCB-E]
MHREKSTTFILIILLGSFFSLSTHAQKLQIKSILHQQYIPNDEGKMELAAQVKREFNLFNKLALFEEYKVDKDEKLELTVQEKLSYDPKGRHQNTLKYNGEGILQAESKIYWDEYNNKSKVEQIKYDDGQQTSVAVTYLLEYNSEGQKEQEKFFDIDGTQIKGKTWFYNNQKEISKSLLWIENRKEPRKEILTNYKRNNDGDLVQSITTEKVNGKEFRKDIRYFSNNYVVEWKTFIDGKLESHFFNEYRDSVIIRTTRQNKRQVLTLEEAAKEQERINKRTSKSKISKANKDTDIFVTNTEYDAYGNILVTTQSINDRVLTVTQYAYDDYGNQIKLLKVDKENDIKEETLKEYDDWGNISKQIFKKNDKIVKEDHYTYEYFPRD